MNESTSISNEDDEDELSQSFNPLYISNKNDNQLTFASIRFSTRNFLLSWVGHLRKVSTPFILKWIKSYRLKTFISDLFASLVVSAMLIPQGMVNRKKIIIFRNKCEKQTNKEN